MKIRSIVSSAAVIAGALLSLSTSPAQAETVFYPNYALKSQGLDMLRTQVCGMSPDNRYLLCIKRFQPKRGEKAFNTFYIVPVSSTGKVGEIRAFPLPGIGAIGQEVFTPDSKYLLFTLLDGSKLVKMNCENGELTTIMEHVEGKPGFVIYPQIMRLSEGKIMTMGYHYNSEDFVGPQAVANIDPDKTGLEAFDNCQLVDHFQQAIFMRRPYEQYREGHPSLDTGYICGYDLNNTYCEIFSWDGERGTIKQVEDCKGFEDAVSGGTSFAYSVQDKDGTYRLCVYNIKTDEKVVIASGLENPYLYTMISDDGNTVTFIEKTGEAERYYTCYYARADEGWEVKPIEGLEKRVHIGRIRISGDGKFMILHSDDGLRIVELKASTEK